MVQVSRTPSIMSRVIVLDVLAQEGLDLLSQAPGIEFDVRTGLKGDELREALSAYDGAICRSGVKLSGDVLEGNRRLRAIVRAGVGTDNIDKAAATRQGIVVMNTPAGNTLSTAEHTIALMLALSRNIAPANQSLVEGRGHVAAVGSAVTTIDLDTTNSRWERIVDNRLVQQRTRVSIDIAEGDVD